MSRVVLPGKMTHLVFRTEISQVGRSYDANYKTKKASYTESPAARAPDSERRRRNSTRWPRCTRCSSGGPTETEPAASYACPACSC